MIQVNFIARELAEEKQLRIRKYAILGYSGAWLLALLVVLVQFQSQRSLIHAKRQEIEQFKVKIEQVSPLFQRAVQLYNKRNQHKKKLSHLFDTGIESTFIAESLEKLAQALPANFWLQNVQIAALKTKGADNKNKAKMQKRMVISGNVFLDMADQNQDHIKRFQAAIQKSVPFSMAESRLDLNKMSVARMGDRYYHNFEIEFFWPHLFL